MKKKLLFGLFLQLFCTANVGMFGQVAIPKPKIGDSIGFPDGNKGIVFWISPDESNGYLLNFKDYGTKQWGDSSLITKIPAFRNLYDMLLDMNGYEYTRILREASPSTDYAFNVVDFDNGWFLPSLGIMNELYMVYDLIHQKFLNYGGSPILSIDRLWTSTRTLSFNPGIVSYIGGFSLSSSLNSFLFVRSVKEFSILPSVSGYDTTLNYRWNTGDSATSLTAKPTSDSLFSITATSEQGCASTVSQTIFVSSALPKEVFDTICTGYAYANNGFSLPADSNTQAGNFIYTQTLTNSSCDVDIILNLTKKPSITAKITDSFCEGRSYICNGITYDNEGDYVQFLTSSCNCDSTLSLKLSLKKPVFIGLSDTACGHYVWKNQYYYHSGIYSQTFVAANGCDSTVRKSITICNSTYGYLNMDSCNQITYNGVSFFNDTTFIDTLVNSAGCDSLLTVKLNILKSDFDTVHLSNCDSVHYRGDFYYSSTVADTLIDIGICKTLETAFLTVNRSYYNSQNIHGTDSLEYLSNIYYRDTMLIFSHQTLAGCDSVHKVNITVIKSPKPPEPPEPPQPPTDTMVSEIVVYWNKVLAVSNPQNLEKLRDAVYEWYKDDVLLPQSNKDWIEVGEPIPAGKYSVSAHHQGSEILYLERTFDKPFGVSVYPNPVTNGQLVIIVRHSRESGNPPNQGIAGQVPNDGETAIKIFDMNGKCVYMAKPNSTSSIVNSTFIINVSHLPAGTYILQIHTDNQPAETLKIVVQ